VKKYLKYFKYVFRHKYFVMVECFKYGLYWQGIIHDWSKFLPDEFVAYANYFYKGDNRKDRFYTPADGSTEFNYAWLRHQHRNPHHWQHWLLQEDDGGKFALMMPTRYMLEMICDWKGAGKASGFSDAEAWYQRNKDKMVLHECTRYMVEIQLGLRNGKP
jgi:hypothetical protein